MAKKAHKKEVDALTKQIEPLLDRKKIGVIQDALVGILEDAGLYIQVKYPRGSTAKKYPDSIVGYLP